jgi:hypothetical protein
MLFARQRHDGGEGLGIVDATQVRYEGTSHWQREFGARVGDAYLVPAHATNDRRKAS